MVQFPESYFINSEPALPNRLPSSFITQIPYRIGKHDKVLRKASNEFLNHMSLVLGEKQTELDLRCGSNTSHGHYVTWAYAETLPDRMVACAQLMDFAHYFNGLNDTVEPEKADDIHRDLSLVLIFEIKSQRRYEPRFPINKIGRQLIHDILEIDREAGIDMLKGWARHMKANIESPQGEWTLDMYCKYRLEQGAASWAIDCVPWSAGLHVTLAQKESTRYFMDDILIACLLVNDLISFEKEFDEHAERGTLDRLRNAVAVLMRNYGYSEEDARGIIQKESLRMEKNGLSKYHQWENSGNAKPDNLRKFVLYSMLMCSGSAYWMSHSPRYNRSQFSYTAESRTQALCKRRKDMKALKGYFPPDSCKNRENTVVEFMRPFEAHFHEAPVEFVDAPYNYLASLPGKNLRKALIDGLNGWLQVPDLSLNIIKEVAEMLHNSSLMLDDIEDGSVLRRGKPSVHMLYGHGQTINSANCVYARSVKRMLSLKSMKSLEVFTDELENLHRGQSMDLAWRYNAHVPSVEQYVTMVDSKTGGLFCLIARLLQAESTVKATPDLLTVATLFGRYYQIRDDYCNLMSEEYTARKGFCEDLAEGKLSLPVIHVLNNYPHPEILRGILLLRSRSTLGEMPDELKRFVLATMKQVGSLKYVKQILEELHEKILELVERIEGELGWNATVKLLVLKSGL